MGITKDGKTAVFHLTLQAPTIQVNEHSYTFQHRKGVSMAWIAEDDVMSVLQITQICCGGRPKHNFQLANQAQVDLWTSQGG